jgi:heme/copper-type cytochrome/quinol oxidase subunit 2
VIALHTPLTTVSAMLAAGEWKYWLPPNHSTHGDAIDNLFIWIFWITTITFFLVEGTLIVFLIKYRYRPERRKAVFTHGNTRLEMAWTLIPAVILLVIALGTKRVWDNYRFAAFRDDPGRAQILVVGEQFKWNFVMPGPDQKLGRYLVYPQPADAKYRAMPRDAALKAINADIAQNPLGQALDPRDKEDPGADDDYARNPGRPLVVPYDRPIDLHLTAKDVLHDFFLPEFRVKLDAVPGMRGHIYFQSRFRSTQRMKLEDVPADSWVWLDTTAPQVTPAVEMSVSRPRRYQIFDPTDKTRTIRSRVWLNTFESLADAARKRLQRTGMSLEDIAKDPQRLAAEVDKVRADLKGLGVTELSVVQRKFEVVCEELCGANHHEMRGEMVVVSNEEYLDYLKLSASTRPTAAPRPATQPVASAAGQ